jgi:hypothetical protein
VEVKSKYCTSTHSRVTSHHICCNLGETVGLFLLVADANAGSVSVGEEAADAVVNEMKMCEIEDLI